MSDARPPRNAFAEFLKVQPSRGEAFTARMESFWGASDPGDLLARAVLGIWGDRPPSAFSMQSGFFRPVVPDTDVNFTAREVASQIHHLDAAVAGQLTFETTLRFGSSGSGLDFQTIHPDPALPAPESLPSEAEVAAGEGWAPFAVGPLETRRTHPNTPVALNEPFVWTGWIVPREPLPANPALHAAAVSFLSAYRHHWSIERRLAAEFMNTTITILNHSLWVHRPVQWSDFLLVRTCSEIGVGGNCFGRREIFDRDGSLIASAAWEAHARKSA